MQNNKQARAWCFTINNPTGLLDETIFEPYRYVCYGEEVGDNGTYHFQGYVSFTAGRYFNALRAFGPEWHWEIARGTAHQNRDYCSKQNIGFYEYGAIPAQGKRSDLLGLREAVRTGSSDLAIISDDATAGPFIRYPRATTLMRNIFMSEQRNWPMELIFICGPTGTNKTKTAFEMAVNMPNYWKRLPSWWDGYYGQHTVVWDEFMPDSEAFGFMLGIVDRYPFCVNQKGTSFNFCSRRIIFTSNFHPDDWFPSYKDNQEPWKRRVREFGRILFTGEVHQRVAPVLRFDPDAPANH